MKIKTVVGLAGASAASLVGMAGLVANPADAASATTMPASNLTAFLAANYGNPFGGVPILAAPGSGSFLPSGFFPNIKVTGNCPSWLFNDVVALNFTTGNAVVYQGSSSPVAPFLPGGLNAVGTAQLVDQGTGTNFVGPAHAWVGQSGNANGQQYAGETFTFTGTAGGMTISFSVNPGFVKSPGGHFGGWGQQNLSCSGFPTS